MKQEVRTTQQNKAYWAFQGMLATELKNQGITMQKLIEHIDIPPTDKVLHEIYKQILLSMYGKDSTRGMTREEMNNCLDVYLDALSKIGVHLEFPSRDKNNLLQFY